MKPRKNKVIDAKFEVVPPKKDKPKRKTRRMHTALSAVGLFCLSALPYVIPRLISITVESLGAFSAALNLCLIAVAYSLGRE